MNGKEKEVLSIVANDVKWMRDKQKKHDDLLTKIFDKLEKGSGKIESNRTAIKYLYVLIVFVAGAVGFLFKHIFQ